MSSRMILTLLCYLLVLMEVELSASTPIAPMFSKLRNVRDTRNIPSDQFKPLQPGGAPQAAPINNNANAQTPEKTIFDESSKAEIRTDGVPTHSQTSDSHRSRSFSRPGSNFPSAYDGQFGLNFPNTAVPIRETNPYSDEDDFPNSAASRHFQTIEAIRNRHTPIGPIGPVNDFSSRSIPLMSRVQSFGPSQPSSLYSFSPSGSMEGFPNNFRRSESYSFTSDGNGPPRVEHNVFDSNLGFGVQRNF